MANQFAKKTIDFDVYERQDPASLIDWGKQAKVISDTFTGIAEEREKKKAAIEKSFADQQQKLTLEFYEKRISAIEARLEKMTNGH